MRPIPSLKPACAALIWLALIFGCSSSGSAPVYSLEKDLQALERIEHTWTADIGGRELRLSICEDIAANAEASSWEDGCRYDHIVRSREPAEKRRAERSEGCAAGGCEFMTVTFVRAVVLDAQGKSAALSGEVHVGDGHRSDPYGATYDVWLWADGSDNEALLKLRIGRDGTAVIQPDGLDSLEYAPSADGVRAQAAGEAQCEEPSEESSGGGTSDTPEQQAE